MERLERLKSLAAALSTHFAKLSRVEPPTEDELDTATMATQDSNSAFSPVNEAQEELALAAGRSPDAGSDIEVRTVRAKAVRGQQEYNSPQFGDYEQNWLESIHYYDDEQQYGSSTSSLGDGVDHRSYLDFARSENTRTSRIIQPGALFSDYNEDENGYSLSNGSYSDFLANESSSRPQDCSVELKDIDGAGNDCFLDGTIDERSSQMPHQPPYSQQQTSETESAYGKTELKSRYSNDTFYGNGNQHSPRSGDLTPDTPENDYNDTKTLGTVIIHSTKRKSSLRAIRSLIFAGNGKEIPGSYRHLYAGLDGMDLLPPVGDTGSIQFTPYGIFGSMEAHMAKTIDIDLPLCRQQLETAAESYDRPLPHLPNTNQYAKYIRNNLPLLQELSKTTQQANDHLSSISNGLDVIEKRRDPRLEAKIPKLRKSVEAFVSSYEEKIESVIGMTLGHLLEEAAKFTSTLEAAGKIGLVEKFWYRGRISATAESMCLLLKRLSAITRMMNKRTISLLERYHDLVEIVNKSIALQSLQASIQHSHQFIDPQMR